MTGKDLINLKDRLAEKFNKSTAIEISIDNFGGIKESRVTYRVYVAKTFNENFKTQRDMIAFVDSVCGRS